MNSSEIAFVTVSITLIIAVVGLVFYYLFTKSKERLLLISSGGDPEQLNTSTRKNTFILQLGVVILGISIGLSAGGIFNEISQYQHSVLIFMITTGISSSLSLFACYYIQRPSKKKELPFSKK